MKRRLVQKATFIFGKQVRKTDYIPAHNDNKFYDKSIKKMHYFICYCICLFRFINRYVCTYVDDYKHSSMLGIYKLWGNQNTPRKYRLFKNE